MAITGNLKTMELAELLQWVSHSRKTGTLVIDNGDVAKRIIFEEGKIIAAASSDPKEYLGHFLVSHGFIDELTLAKAMDMQNETRMLLGKILVTIGAISEDALEQMLRLKAEEGIYQIFTWDEGDFEFLDEETPEFTMLPISIEVTSVVLEGLRRVDEWKAIRRHIASPLTVPVKVGELEPPEDEKGASKILALVNDDRTVSEIALQTHSSEFYVCRVLYEQIRQGRLKVVRPRNLAPLVVQDRESVDSEALLKTALEYVDEGTLDLALRHLKAARSLAPDDQKVRIAVDRAEDTVRQRIEKAGVVLEAVPRLTAAVDDLASLEITPQEGFILSRIDGSYDLRTLLKITPMPQLEAQVVFWKLLQAGYVEVTEPDA